MNTKYTEKHVLETMDQLGLGREEAIARLEAGNVFQPVGTPNWDDGITTMLKERHRPEEVIDPK